jgi:futalosine hydrolase
MLLVVTAVAAEREAVLAGAPELTVQVVGVGPAAAAAGTARLLALAEAGGRPYQMVVSAGIGGGFAGRTRMGDTVVATRSVAADLGADSAEGFLPLDVLGFGSTEFPAQPLGGGFTAGAVLTVSTVTGTVETAELLAARYPDAVAEGMEGYGVACAAALSGVAFAELRTISNLIGARERSTWQLGTALAALTAAAPALAQVVR